MTIQISHEEAEKLCRDGIDAVELYSIGTPAIELDDLEGVILYAQLLEATIMTLYAAAARPTDVEAIRDAARKTAAAWRSRAT